MEPLIIAASIFGALGLVLLLHHGWVHAHDPPESNARQESCVWACYFQTRDVAHLEAWVLVCLTCGLTLALLCAQYIAAACLCAVGLVLAALRLTCFWDDRTVCVHNLSNHETYILVCFTNAALCIALRCTEG